MLQVGRVTGVHGLNGTIQVYSYTRPASGIAGYSRWWIGDAHSQSRAFEVKRCWQHGRRILAQLVGVATIEDAEALKGKGIWVARTDVELEEGEYLWEDLVGCRVLDEQGGLLGHVARLEDYGAQDILVVQTPDGAETPGEWMIPFVEHVVIRVDLPERTIHVALPPGMDACFTSRF